LTDYVDLGQSGSEVNLIDGIDYLIIRDGFKWDEVWADVITPLRGGGSRIGKHILSKTVFDWGFIVRPQGASYETAIQKLKNLRAILALAPKNAQGTNPVYYTESVAGQITLIKYKVLAGTCVPTDRMLVQAGVIRCHLHLEFDGASPGGL